MARRRFFVNSGLLVAPLLFVLAATFIDKAASEGECRTGCGGVDGGGGGTPAYFKFVEGTTYKYHYEGNITISLSNAGAQHSTTKVSAIVLLTQLPHCDLLLRVQNFQVIASDGKKHTNIEGIGKPVRLNFHDGHLEDVICADATDTQNSLNIKRAMASMFQAAYKHSYETDVFGVCPTQFSISGEGQAVIKKSRNLNGCARREHLTGDFVATVFNFDSEVKTSPFLQGNYASEQRINKGLLHYASVTESYLFVPFSAGSDGVRALVQAELDIFDVSDEVPDEVNVTRPVSIIFENPTSVASHVASAASILKAVKETADCGGGPTVKDSSANKFSNLIRLLRTTKKADVLAAYSNLQAGVEFACESEARKIFLDGLLRVGNGDAIEVAFDLYQKKEFTEQEAKLFFLGLSLVKHVTPAALKAAAVMVSETDLPREAFLGVGTLVSRFCRANSCNSVDELDLLLTSLASKIKTVHDRKSENTVIAALKALANAKYVPDDVVAKVASIAQDRNAPARIRVTALETYLANPCNNRFRESALDVVRDIQQDSEIRIKAYLAVAQCPDEKIADALQKVLNGEPSYQVGGFIVSHLRTLRTSANPNKALAKVQLGQVDTANSSYPFDRFKYSYNEELSYSSNTFGLGCSVESNVIFSQRSFLPRSASLNLTAQVFGHTFNFLEVEARQESLDRVVERYFGPLGVLRQRSTSGFRGDEAKKWMAIRTIEGRINAVRGKRDVLDYIGEQLKDQRNELDKDLDLDVSVKLFGSEVLLLGVNEDTSKLIPEVLIDKIFDAIDEKVIKAKNFEDTYRSDGIFLDAEVAYPTSLGFPLRLNVEGTSVVRVKTAGNVDLKALLSGKDFKLKFSLVPSANVQVAGRFTLDAALVQSGLKLVANLHTATGGSFDVEVTDDGDGVDIKFSLPLDKQEVFGASHYLVFETRELGRPEVDKPVKFGAQSKEFTVCLDQLGSLVGLYFCAQINRPSVATTSSFTLPNPLDGNSKLRLFVEKDDLAYFRYKARKYDSESRAGVKAGFEVVGRGNDKKLKLEGEVFLKPEVRVRALFLSGFERALLAARIINGENEKAVFVEIGGDSHVYALKMGALVSGNPRRRLYRPLVTFKVGEGPEEELPYNVKGLVIVESFGEDTNYTFKGLQFVVPHQKPITINGSAQCKPKHLDVDLTLSDGEKSGTFNGFVQLVLNDIKVHGKLSSNINPQANFDIKYEYKTNDTDTLSDLRVMHGRKENVFRLSNSFRRVSSHREYATKNRLSYPILDIGATFDFATRPKSVEYEVDLAYKGIKMGSVFDAEVDGKSVGDFDIAFELYGFNNKLEVNLLSEANGYKSHVKHRVAVNGKALEFAGTIDRVAQNHSLDVTSDLTVKLTGYRDMKYYSNVRFVLGKVDLFVVKLTSESAVYVDVFYDLSSTGEGKGYLRINFEGVLISDGQIALFQGKGRGVILVQLSKYQRKIKCEAGFGFQDPVHDLDVVLYTSYEKDDARKYVVSTHNQLKQGFVDSKNVIDFVGQKLEVNVKSIYEGKLMDGKQRVEVDLTLPSQFYLAGKLDREVHLVRGVLNAVGVIILEQRDSKATPGRTLTVKAAAKDANFVDNVYDITYNIMAVSGGKTINLDLVAKERTQSGDTHLTERSVKAYGSVLPEAIEVALKAERKDFYNKGAVRCVYGKVAALDINGRYDLNSVANVPYVADIGVTLSTPGSKIKSVKFHAAASVLLAESDDDLVDAKGSMEIFADGADGDAMLDVKTDVEVYISVANARVKGTFLAAKADPIVVEADYSREETIGGESKCRGEATVQYAGAKKIGANLTVAWLATKECSLDGNFVATDAEAGQTRLQVRAGKFDYGKRFASEIVLTDRDGRLYVLSDSLVLLERAPALEVQLQHPNGKKDRLAAKVTKLGAKSFGAVVQVAYNERGFDFEGEIDVNADDGEDFSLMIKADSSALKLDKLVVMANAEGTRKIRFSAKVAGDDVLSGFTTYEATEAGGKVVIVGSGRFLVKGANQLGHFRYVRRYIDNGLENGVEVSFEGALGTKAIESAFKVTNRHFRIANSYCEEVEQCARFEIDARAAYVDFASYSNVLEVDVDLRKLGLPHELGLKAVTARSGLEFDHNVALRFRHPENEYSYGVRLRPGEASVTFSTPKRVVSVEANVNLPRSGQISPIRGGILLYLNKKSEPQKKTALTFVLSGVSPVGGDRVLGKVAFSHPALVKELSVSYDASYDVSTKEAEATVVVDVFPNSKVIRIAGRSEGVFVQGYGTNLKLAVDIEPINYKFRGSETFLIDFWENWRLEYGVNYAATIGNEKVVNSFTLKIDGEEADCRLTLNDREVLGVKSVWRSAGQVQVVSTQYSGLGFEPTLSRLEVKNFNSLSYYVHRTSKPDHKLQLSCALIPGQIADFRIFVNRGAAGGGLIDLVHAFVKLDEADFLKSDYAWNAIDIKRHLLEPVELGAEALIMAGDAELSRAVNGAWRRMATIEEHLKRNAPHFKPVTDYYASELSKLKEEVVTDESVREISKALDGIFGAMARAFAELLGTVTRTSQQLVGMLQATCAVVVNSLDSDFLPKLKQLLHHLGLVFAGVFEVVSNSVLAVLGQVSDFLDNHREEFKQIATLLSGPSQDVGRFLLKSYQQVKITVLMEANLLLQELKALNIYERLRSVYVQLKERMLAPEVVVEALQNVGYVLGDLLGIEEVKVLMDRTAAYVEKVVKTKRVHDALAIEGISEAAHDVVRKALKQLEQTELIRNVLSGSLTANLVYGIPRLVFAKFSPLNRLLAHERRDFDALLRSVNFNPRSWIPPYRFYGYVIQGRHIFTFDAGYLTCPGECDYLLVRDAVNGNFSVAASYSDGFLTALTISDRTDVIIIKKNGQVLLNGVPAEYPVRQNLLDARRTHETLSVASKAGFEVTCTSELLACEVMVSGFYHGQMKGMLGNGNNERYDDFTLPSGKIVTSRSDFANAYRMQSGCPTVNVDANLSLHANSCAALFKSDVDLSICYNYINPTNYLEACDRGVAAGVSETEKYIAGAYVTACRLKYIPVELPERYVTACKNGYDSVNVGESFSVGIPQKSADVVIVVDVSESNEQVYKALVMPLTQILTRDLHYRGIRDVEYHVIVYGGDNGDHPLHVTANGGKLSFKGRLPSLKFSKTPEEFNISAQVVFASDLLNDAMAALPKMADNVKLALGNTAQAKAYDEATNYPFRAEAVKAVIAVTGSPCRKSSLVLLQKLLAHRLYDKALSFHVIAPMNEDFKLRDGKASKTVIGFNDQHVLTFTECRKKPLGDKPLRSDLKFDDFCADFALKSGGNVFVSDNFLAARAYTKKLFASIAAYNIAETLATEEKELNCECERVRGTFHVRNKCSVVKFSKKPPTGIRMVMRG